MASQEATVGSKSSKAMTSSVGSLSWDPEANSVLIHLSDRAATDTEVEEGGVIVQRDRTGAAVILEILCVREGVSAGALAALGRHSAPAQRALCTLLERLPVTYHTVML